MVQIGWKHFLYKTHEDMKKILFFLSLSLFLSMNSLASTTPANESNSEQKESTAQLKDDIKSTSEDKDNRITETCEKAIEWSTLKSSAKPFGYGILFGIVGTILCIYFRPDKYILRKIISMLSKFIEHHKNKESAGNTIAETTYQVETTTEESSTDLAPTQIPKPLPIPPNPMPEPISITINPTTFAIDGDKWSVIGSSVIGNSHISMNLPCQDNCKYEYIGEGWGIAVTSDGAGSAKRSEIGSKIVAERAIVHFKQLIEELGWMQNNELPTDAVWSKHAYTKLNKIYQEIVAFAKTKELDYKDLSATAIILIHTPKGVLCTHIGDGRAGYRDESGEWKAIITPHKGEEANQTIFITSDFWSIPNYTMSDVFVPESIVIREEITAFTLMSDGCEHTAWQCNYFDAEKNKYYDPNRPHDKLYESLSKTLVKYHAEGVDINRRKEQWQQFLVDGNKSFQKESDDKTMILGVLCESNNREQSC